MRNEIVILEDNADRRQHMLARLRDRFPPYPVHISETAQAMIAHLEIHLPFAKVISLDHDLEPANELDPDPGTGRDVANFLLKQVPCCPIVLHTTNYHAALAMESDLQETGWQVQRVTPYDDLAWIDREWFWAMREALVTPATQAVLNGAAISADALCAAKEFVSRVGGVDNAKAAVDHLAELLSKTAK